MGILTGTSFRFSEEYIEKLMAEGRQYMAGLEDAKAERAEDEAPDDQEVDEEEDETAGADSVWLSVLGPELFQTHSAVRDFVAGETFEALSTVAMSVSAESHGDFPDSVRSQGLAVSSFIARDLSRLAQVSARDPEAFVGVGVAFDKFHREDVLAFTTLAASQGWCTDALELTLRVLLDDQAEDEGGSE